MQNSIKIDNNSFGRRAGSSVFSRTFTSCPDSFLIPITIGRKEVKRQR